MIVRILSTQQTKLVQLKKIHIPTKKIIYSTLSLCVGYYAYDSYIRTSLEIISHPDAGNKYDKLSQMKYVPTFYLPHRLLQLIYCTRVEPPIQIQFERQIFKLQDGGQLALDWVNKDSPTQKPLILITHGLTGGSDSNYIKDAAQRLKQLGYQVVCFNQRGVAKCSLATSRYHFHGCTKDLEEVIDYLHENNQGRQIIGVGFSIGANLMLKYAGQQGKNCKIDRIISIANPYNLLTCSHNILKFSNWVYDMSITKNFKWLLSQHQHSLKELEPTKGISIEKGLKAKNTWEFDEYITRRLFDFKSPTELYEYIGCENVIHNVQVPTLCIHSKDDPIVPEKIIPQDKLLSNKYITLLTTNRGSHVEWLTGIKPRRWIMDLIINYLDSI
ncbi:hypothetical protein pb186bvf_016786 [Paramecium bursaria]